MANKSETGYAKKILLGANTLFAIIGFIFLIVKALINKQFITTTYITLGIFGLLLIIFTYLGFFSKQRNDDFMIIIFSACLLIIFIAEMSVGLSDKLHYKKIFLTKMYSVYNITKFSKNDFLSLDIDNIQIEKECCGWMNPADWAVVNLPIPSSCCSTQNEKTATNLMCTVNSTELHSTGCNYKIDNATYSTAKNSTKQDFTNRTKTNDYNAYDFILEEPSRGGSGFYRSGRIPPAVIATLLG